MARPSTFGEVFVQVAETALATQDAGTGAMPAGCNGPYGDPETQVRNTSHWLQTFIRAGELSGDRRFRDAARRCAEYLLGTDAPRSGVIFQQRTSASKDHCNGVIGPAWTIEGLTAANRFLDLPECGELARQMFLAHPVSTKTGLWHRVEPDGSVLSEDMTFNHQLWFCAVGAFLDDQEVAARVRAFMDRLSCLVAQSDRGRILQAVMSFGGCCKEIARGLVRPGHAANQLGKEVGYHAFNLYGFALLHERTGDHPYWSSRSWQRALAYQGTEEFLSGLGYSPYGFPYNPPGFELPFVNAAFGTENQFEASSQQWICRQVQHGFDEESTTFSRGTRDPVTATARIYECWRLPVEIFSQAV